MNRKRIKNFIGMTWFTIVMLFGSYLFYQDSTIREQDLKRFTGVVIDKGITKHTYSTSRGSSSSKVFFFKLKGLDQILATYNDKRSYTHLDNNLQIGNKISVLYKYSKKKEEPNVDVYQIEKNNTILLNQKEYRTSRLIGSIIALIGALITLTIGIRMDIKGQKLKITAYNTRYIP